MARWPGRSRSLLPALLLAGPSLADVAPAELSFALDSQPTATRDLAWIRTLAPRPVRVFEPYEGREVEFEAVPLPAVLDAVYGRGWRSREELLFTCRDGYQPTVPVRRVLEHEAWLAFDRTGQDGFSIWKLESGRRQRIPLGPFYLIWENLDDARVRLEGDYGWPYQLVGIDLVRTRDRFPKMAPPQDAPETVRAGFDAFRMHCSRCHPINGEGGTIGPELNGELNPVEYRRDDWLRQWIDDPSQINPTSRMPRLNPALPDRGETIDALVTYLRAMAAARRGQEPVGGP